MQRTVFRARLLVAIFTLVFFSLSVLADTLPLRVLNPSVPSFNWSGQSSCTMAGATVAGVFDPTLPDLSSDGIVIKRELGRGGMGRALKGVVKNGDKVEWVVVKEALPGMEEFLEKEYARDSDLVALDALKRNPNPHRARLVSKNGRKYLVIPMVTATDHFPEQEAATSHGPILAGQWPEFSFGSDRDTAFINRYEQTLMEEVERHHQANVVHCDLKPENVLIRDDGTAKVIDRGLARLGVAQRDNPRGEALGTMGWMDRESWYDVKITFRRDVRNVQRLLLWARARPAMHKMVTEKKGVERNFINRNWYEPDHILDDDNYNRFISPEEALILGGHLPKDIPELRSLLKTAREDQKNFGKVYAEMFDTRWATATLGEKEDLLYDLVHSEKYGTKIFFRLSKEVQKEVAVLARDALKLIDPNVPNGPIGFHTKSPGYLRVFLADPMVSLRLPKS